MVMPKALSLDWRAATGLGGLLKVRHRRDVHRSWIRSPQGQQVLLKEFGDCGRCPFIFLTPQTKGLLKLFLWWSGLPVVKGGSIWFRGTHTYALRLGQPVLKFKQSRWLREEVVSLLEPKSLAHHIAGKNRWGNLGRVWCMCGTQEASSCLIRKATRPRRGAQGWSEVLLGLKLAMLLITSCEFGQVL